MISFLPLSLFLCKASQQLHSPNPCTHPSRNTSCPFTDSTCVAWKTQTSCWKFDLLLTYPLAKFWSWSGSSTCAGLRAHLHAEAAEVQRFSRTCRVFTFSAQKFDSFWTRFLCWRCPLAPFFLRFREVSRSKLANWRRSLVHFFWTLHLFEVQSFWLGRWTFLSGLKIRWWCSRQDLSHLLASARDTSYSYRTR